METKTVYAAEAAAGKPAFKAPVIAVYQFPPEKGIDAGANGYDGGNISNPDVLAFPCEGEG